MMSVEKTSVLIVGAGPVGLSAAVALAKSGVDIAIIEESSQIDQRMRASTFHPPTLDMLDELDLAEPLIALGLKVPRWQLRHHESGRHVTFDLGTIRDATSHPYRLQCEQHRLCSLAVEALASLGLNVRFGSRCTAVRQDAEGVTATLSDGHGDVRCDWLIGADGGGSTVRSALGIDYGGMTYTHSSVLVSTPFPFHDYLDQLADVSYCWSARGPFSLLRLKSLWRASLYPGVEDLDEAAKEELVRDWLGYIVPEARDAELVDVAPYRVHERCVGRFRAERVLLAGDAAHLNPPSGGMGMNGGIHDALNLTQKLVTVINGADASLLDRYDRQRRYVASQRVIPQASSNRARMATRDPEVQRERLEEYAALAADAAKCRDFLLKSSMIAGLREVADIE